MIELDDLQTRKLIDVVIDFESAVVELGRQWNL